MLAWKCVLNVTSNRAAIALIIYVNFEFSRVVNSSHCFLNLQLDFTENKSLETRA